MYQNTITVFNYHSGKWYPTIIEGVNLVETTGASKAAVAGTTNGDSSDFIIHTAADKTVTTRVGKKAYLSPKAYAKTDAPARYITFKPEQDFIYNGVWESTEPIVDADCGDEGLYSALNEEYDGVYMITYATWFGLLPHFEIGGR